MAPYPNPSPPALATNVQIEEGFSGKEKECLGISLRLFVSVYYKLRWKWVDDLIGNYAEIFHWNVTPEKKKKLGKNDFSNKLLKIILILDWWPSWLNLFALRSQWCERNWEESEKGCMLVHSQVVFVTVWDQGLCQPYTCPWIESPRSHIIWEHHYSI